MEFRNHKKTMIIRCLVQEVEFGREMKKSGVSLTVFFWVKKMRGDNLAPLHCFNDLRDTHC